MDELKRALVNVLAAAAMIMFVWILLLLFSGSLFILT